MTEPLIYASEKPSGAPVAVAFTRPGNETLAALFEAEESAVLTRGCV